MSKRIALLAATLALTACGGGGGEGGSSGAIDATGPAEAQVATVVSNDQLKFAPATVNAKIGTLTLTHRNGGSIPHNLVFDDETLGGTETIGGDEQEALTLKLERKGTYAFVCTIHSGQEGKVVVS